MGDRFDKILEMGNRTQLAQITTQYKTDLLNAGNLNTPWSYRSVQSGSSIPVLDNNAKHPGVASYVSHASNVNSGYGYNTDINSILIAGGEKTTVIFKTATTLAGVIRRMGFHDSTSSADATDGVYFEQSGDTLYGKTANNATRSTTVTSFTLSADTWYRAVIQLNSDATLATFTLYSDDAYTVLWTDTLAENIPTGANRNVSSIDICTLTSPSSATIIGYLDYIDFILPSARKVK